MNIAVVLCTYNRCQSLAKALESLAVSCVPGYVRWRVLVVDNNSSDQTRAVVEDFARRFLGRFEYHFERRQGKSHALNLGIQHANADILAFVDDDVQVDAHWLHKITVPMEDPQCVRCSACVEVCPTGVRSFGYVGAGGLPVLDRLPASPARMQDAISPDQPIANLRGFKSR